MKNVISNKTKSLKNKKSFVLKPVGADKLKRKYEREISCKFYMSKYIKIKENHRKGIEVSYD